MIGLFCQHSYCSILAKYLLGHCNYVPIHRILSHLTYRMTVFVHVQVTYLLRKQTQVVGTQQVLTWSVNGPCWFLWHVLHSPKFANIFTSVTIPTLWQVSASDRCLSNMPIMGTQLYICTCLCKAMLCCKKFLYASMNASKQRPG